MKFLLVLFEKKSKICTYILCGPSLLVHSVKPLILFFDWEPGCSIIDGPHCKCSIFPQKNSQFQFSLKYSILCIPRTEKIEVCNQKSWIWNTCPLFVKKTLTITNIVKINPGLEWKIPWYQTNLIIIYITTIITI